MCQTDSEKNKHHKAIAGILPIVNIAILHVALHRTKGSFCSLQGQGREFESVLVSDAAEVPQDFFLFFLPVGDEPPGVTPQELYEVGGVFLPRGL